MAECTEKTRALLLSKKELIEKLAEALLQKETIDQSVIMEVLGTRPFKMSKQHEEYVRERKKLSEENEAQQKASASKA